MTVDTVLFLDPWGGIAGDMILGALVDVGWDAAALRSLPGRLGLGGQVTVTVEKVNRGAVAATAVRVTPASATPATRTLADIEALLTGGDLAATVAARAMAVFRTLARGEAAVHGSTSDAVHFHEVGALDAVVDIVGAVQALNDLRVDGVWCGPLPLGSGSIESAHGLVPAPSPATLKILADSGSPTTPPPLGTDGEMVTPTGAAVVVTLARFGRPAMMLRAVGHGAGARDPAAYPNVLRAWLGTAPPADAAPHEVVVVETDIDDMGPELYGHLLEALAAAGALDASLTPVFMKKSRPGTRLTVIAPPALEGALVSLILAESTSLGVRVRRERRHVVPRRRMQVDTPYGRLAVKRRDGPGGVAFAPEYEDCHRAATRTGTPLVEVYAAAAAAARATQPPEDTGAPDTMPDAIDDLIALLAGTTGRGAPTWSQALEITVLALADAYPHFHWTGIYVVDGDDLVLGPFVGPPTEHTRIPVGTGICGAAAARGETVVVDDVADDPRYLACFASTRSEIVVPVFAAEEGGRPRVVAEIDVDSDQAAAFGPSDRRGLELVARHLGQLAPPSPTDGVSAACQLRQPGDHDGGDPTPSPTTGANP